MSAPTTPRPFHTDHTPAPIARLRIPTGAWVVAAIALACLVLVAVSQIIMATEMLDMMALLHRNNG
jgi:hypothetical protein